VGADPAIEVAEATGVQNPPFVIHTIDFGPLFIGLAGDQGDQGPTRRSIVIQDSAPILVAPPRRGRLDGHLTHGQGFDDR
jgi:hypothetical protein